MIIYLIIFIFSIIISHIIFENLFLPLRRRHYEFRLYALRDKLRSLNIKYSDKKYTPVVSMLQSNINGMINSSYKVDIYSLIEFRKNYNTNSKLREKILNNKELIEKSGIEEMKEITTEMTNIWGGIIIWNSAALAFYVIPAFIFLLLIEKIFSWIKNSVLATEESLIPYSHAY